MKLAIKMKLSIQPYKLILISVCLTTLLEACHIMNPKPSAKYRENCEKINIYSYEKFGRLHIVLDNINKHYRINYGLQHGFINIYDNLHSSIPGRYEGITDTTNGLYQTNIYEDSPIYPTDSLEKPVYKISKIAYLSDSLKNTKRIYISNLERD